MSLQHIQVNNFRNLTCVQLELSSVCNLFYGANGAGKTSILEAICFLGLGRSFRSHLLRRITQEGADGFTLFGKIYRDNTLIPVGITRAISGDGQTRIAGETVNSVAELARLIPIQLINQHSYRLFELGPKMRRQFIDWGMFHVEPTFLSLWKRMLQILHQRNALLRTVSSWQGMSHWDIELVRTASELHTARQKFITIFTPIVNELLNQLLPNIVLTIDYYPGWKIARDLSNILQENFNGDTKLGYTQFGPHRADLLFKIGNAPAQDVLSRGQQKLLLIALHLAQGLMLRNLTQKSCIYLIDDLLAELDTQKSLLVAQILNEIKAQLFITSLDETYIKSLFPSQEIKMFNVTHGVITETA